MRVYTYQDSKRTDSTHAHTRHSAAFSSTRQDHNGGALKLELGAVGVFQGTADFTDISIIPADTGIRRFVRGAAIHSKVCCARTIAADVPVVSVDCLPIRLSRECGRKHLGTKPRRQVTRRHCCCCCGSAWKRKAERS